MPLTDISATMDDLPEPVRELRKEYRLNFVIGILAFVAVAAFQFYVQSYFSQPESAFVTFVGEPEMLTPTDVCPGDWVRYRVAARIRSDVVIDGTASIFALDDGGRFILSEDIISNRIVMSGPADTVIHRAWQVPAEFVDPSDGMMRPMPPGNYERRVAIGTEFRDAEPEILVIAFTIRGDCE